MSAGNLLALDGLSVRFPSAAPDVYAVDRVDLRLAAGQMLAVVGESGGGKSMLGLAICGLLPPEAIRSGVIRWRGETLHAGGGAADGLLGREMAMVFQDPAASLDPVLTVGAQLLETIGYLKGLRGDAARRGADALLREVGLRDSHLYFNRYPHQLSGGQRQRVMLALAIAGDPALLVADEPTTALDPSLRLNILGLLNDLSRSRRMATLFITHDISLAAAAASEMVVMQRGRIVDQGSADTLLQSPGADHTRALIAAQPANMTPPPGPPPSTGEPLLRIEALTVDYRARRGWLGMREETISPLHPVDLEIRVGEALALVGESGCGKTTLARAASLLLTPATGSIRLDGERLDPKSPGAKRRRIQMIFQDAFASLNPRQRCGEVLGEAISLTTGSSARENRLRRDELLRTVDLDPTVLDRYPHQLSGGQRQRVAVARALAAEPRLIIADEPTSSLDLPTQAEVMNLFTRLRCDLQVGILLITHDLELARAACNRIAVMYAGLIVEIFAADSEPLHPYSRQLMTAGTRSIARKSSDTAAPETTAGAAIEAGCPCAPICPLADAQCRAVLPALEPITKDHFIRCPKSP